jgi:hypothetical protein
MNSAGRIRATTEVNFKSRMDAYVFGEDDRVVNPGDLLIVMSEAGPGDRLGNNIRQFEISIAGDQMDNLFDQVTRAKDLFDLNREWLKTPASTPGTGRIAVDEHRLAIHLKDINENVPSLARSPRLSVSP